MAEFFPTDVLVEVLRWLPSSARRRSRLVCRLWRDTVDTRTTKTRSRPRTLVATKEHVRLIEDLPSSSSSDSDGSRDLWADNTFKGMSLVDTCNGLVCMCDDEKPGGAITLANPVTGEALAMPPLPLRYAKAFWYAYLLYAFAYHPTTGRYKVVYAPSSLNRVWVFTLGEAAWRVVEADDSHTPTETFNLNMGIVSVNGAVYYAVKEPAAKVISFDLDDEHITSIRPLPSVLSRPGSWRLTQVRGRLGIAFSHESPRSEKTEVWVMEHAMVGQCTWSRWYSVLMHNPGHLCHHRLTHPNFTHGGEHILTMGSSKGGLLLYKYKQSNGGKKTRRVVVEIDKRNQGTVVAHIKTSYTSHRTFAYVETTQALSVCRCW